MKDNCALPETVEYKSSTDKIYPLEAPLTPRARTKAQIWLQLHPLFAFCQHGSIFLFRVRRKETLVQQLTPRR